MDKARRLIMVSVDSFTSNFVGPLSASCHHSPICIFRRTILLIPRVKIKQDRFLDRVMEKEKLVRPVTNIRDLILKSRNKTVPLRFFPFKKKELRLNKSVAKIENLIRRYPNIFEIYQHPKEKQLWCRLTKEALGLLEEERKIYAEQENIVVDKLCKLLMMSRSRRIAVYKLDWSKRYFGFPDDFRTTILPNYPEKFCLELVKKPFIVEEEEEEEEDDDDDDKKRKWLRHREMHRKPVEYLKLVKWDESLAVSQHEWNAKEAARQKGLGEIDTTGRPLPYKFKYGPGMALRKKVLEKYEQWQKLPYISPYQDRLCAREGTILAEKRAVAVVHEILSLSVEKRTEVKIIFLFLKEYDLPSNFVRLINRFPGMFYICLKGALYTILLRECYERSRLLEESPLVQHRAKYFSIVCKGPSARSRLLMSRGKKGYAISEDDLSDELSSEDESDSSKLTFNEFSVPDPCTEDDDMDIEDDKGTDISEFDTDTDDEERESFRRG